jgi:hypothetical protein
MVVIWSTRLIDSSLSFSWSRRWFDPDARSLTSGHLFASKKSETRILLIHITPHHPRPHGGRSRKTLFLSRVQWINRAGTPGRESRHAGHPSSDSWLRKFEEKIRCWAEFRLLTFLFNAWPVSQGRNTIIGSIRVQRTSSLRGVRFCSAVIPLVYPSSAGLFRPSSNRKCTRFGLPYTTTNASFTFLQVGLFEPRWVKAAC